MTSIPVQNGSLKRPHACFLLISQDDDKDDWMEVSPKRRRYTADDLGGDASPSIVSVMTSSPDKTQRCNTPLQLTLLSTVPLPETAPSRCSVDSTMSSMQQDELQHKPTLEWWKQKPRPIKEKRSAALPQSTLCFVCQCHFTTEPVERHSGTTMLSTSAPRQSPNTVMPENTLLAYFTPLTTRTASQQPLSLSALDETSAQRSALSSSESSPDLCSFCERTACASCLASCETCDQIYCSFCLTTDYNGTFARTVCIDCYRETSRQQKTADQEQEEDAMHVD